MSRVITLDGTSASGTSTAAESLSKELGFGSINSGTFYRMVTNLCGDRPLKELPLCLELLQAHIPVIYADGVSFGSRFIPNKHLRTLEIETIMPTISPIEPIREIVRGWQRAEAAKFPGGFVIEGRDTGTVVFPNARVKFFFDANLAVRAQRAINRLEKKGLCFKGTLEDMMREIETRDGLDRNRENSPLVTAPDAIPIDTTNRNQQETLELILSHARLLLGLAA